MTSTIADTVVVGTGAERREVAVLRTPGGSPGLFWVCGYRSAMTGSKAERMAAHAASLGLAATRFDYSGTGSSPGIFTDGTISRWLEEARAVFATTAGPQIVVGSSMGGWLSLLMAAKERLAPGGGRIAGMVLIAPAVDMTKALMWDAFTAEAQQALQRTGLYLEPSRYSDEPTPVTLRLIEDGEQHLFGDRLIETGCPVHILHGMEDPDVPWRSSRQLVERLASDDVVLTLVKDGDHRLSRPEDLERMTAAIDGLLQEVRGAAGG